MDGEKRLKLVSSLVISALAEHLEDQAEFFQQTRDQVSEDRARSDAGMAALAQAIEALAQRLDSGMGATTDVFGRLADGQEKLMAALQGTAQGGSGSASGDAESRMRLRSIDTQMLRLLEEVAAGRQEALGDLRADLAQLTRAVRALGGRGDAGHSTDGRG